MSSSSFEVPDSKQCVPSYCGRVAGFTPVPGTFLCGVHLFSGRLWVSVQKHSFWGESGPRNWLWVWVRVSRMLAHFKTRLLGSGWTQHNPASSLWPLDLLQHLYLVLWAPSLVLGSIFFYTTLHSTYLLGRSALGIKRSHTGIKSDLLTLAHCAVSCELVLADVVTAESDLWVSVVAAKVADCWWSDGSSGPRCSPGQTLPFWAAGGDVPSRCCEEMKNAGWTLCVRV